MKDDMAARGSNRTVIFLWKSRQAYDNMVKITVKKNLAFYWEAKMKYIVADKKDIELLMQIRLEMLRGVNGLTAEYEFSHEIISESRKYFIDGNQTTILAVDENVIGCASICYVNIMPTFSHPTGKRAHLMNVYVNSCYRRQGIAYQMIKMLIGEAKDKGVTEISLDSTNEGRELYKKLGFANSEECMVLCI